MNRVTDCIRCRAPGKVNLSLAALGRRPDGFHDIESWVVPFDWCDRLVLAPADHLSLTVSGRSEGVPAGETNLAWRAAVALAEAAGRRPDVSVSLEKTLPPGAGLGGGSSDAAAVLLGLNELWRLDWPVKRLAPIAAALGSDVPLFLTAGSAVIRGRGERVERIACPWRGWLVLVIPPFGLSTAAVYAAWSPDAVAAERSRSPWTTPHLNSRALMDLLFNDLERAAFAVEPRLAKLHGELDGLDGRRVRMTGSGSALFSAFDHEVMAKAWRDTAAARVGEEVEVRVVPTG